MKKLIAIFLLLGCGSAATFATDITVAAGTVENFRATNIGVTRTGTVSVTNGSTSVTCSACLPSNLVGKRGYKIAIASVDYYVSATSTTSAFTLSASYTGSTNASASFSLYPMVMLRFYASMDFLPLNATSVVQAGAPGTNNFYLERACSVIDGTVYIPELILPATTDPAANTHKNARWSAWFHRLDGGQLQVYGGFQSFVLPATPTSTTWAAILLYNTPFVQRPPNNNTYNTDQVNSLLDTIIDATPDYILKAKTTNGKRVEDSAMYQSGSTITNSLITDVKGGLPAAAANALPTDGRGQGSLIFDSTNKKYRAYNSTSGRWVALNGDTYNIEDFGAKPDLTSLSCSINAGSTTLTCPFASFTTADTGKTANIPYAAGSNQMLKTTVTYLSATTLTTAVQATASAASVTTYIGTDNTSFIQAAIDAANTAGGGTVLVPQGAYLFNYITLAKKIHLKGSAKEATVLWSNIGSGGAIRSTWPSNSSTAVDIILSDFTLKIIDTIAAVQYGIHDNGGAFVKLNNIAVTNAHIGVLFDQTQVSSIANSNFESYTPAFVGLMSSYDPLTNGSWTKTGSATVSADSNFALINSTGDAASYFSKSLSATAFDKGFTVTALKGVVILSAENAGFDDAKMFRVDNGTYRYDVQFTSTQIRLNGGTARSFAASWPWELRIAIGGATADLWVNGSKVDTAIAGLATAGSAIIGFGDFATTDDAYVGYGYFAYASANPLPANIWLVDGDYITPGNSGDYTNVIQIHNNQFNGVVVHIADDGGTDHVIRENNFNGGLWPLHLTGTVNVAVQNNAFEGNQWHTLVSRSFGVDGTSHGNNSSLQVTGNTFNSVFNSLTAPPIQYISAIDVYSEKNVYTKGSGNAVDVDPSGVFRLEGNETMAVAGATVYSNSVMQSAVYADTNAFATPFNEVNVITDATRSINGVVGGARGRTIIITNEGSFDLVISHQHASPDPDRRIITSTGHNLLVEPGNRVRLDYDVKNSRWRASLLQ